MIFSLVRILFIVSLFIGGLNSQLRAQDDLFAGRRGLAGPEQMPLENVTCDGLAATLAGLEVPSGDRIDLWVSGALTLIHSDEALWYLAICSDPGIRVMCVTYSDNAMKLGERVLVRGGMRILDETHIVLDPCLASRD
jgi:hypothetical protein